MLARRSASAFNGTESGGPVRAAEFRRLALSLPTAVEAAHMGHADFRVGGRIFATLGHPSPQFAVVMLTPQDQDLLVHAHPAMFAPVAGKWGASGSTVVVLGKARVNVVATALEAAWRRRAPKHVIAEFDSRSQSAV